MTRKIHLLLVFHIFLGFALSQEKPISNNHPYNDGKIQFGLSTGLFIGKYDAMSLGTMLKLGNRSRLELSGMAIASRVHAFSNLPRVGVSLDYWLRLNNPSRRLGLSLLVSNTYRNFLDTDYYYVNGTMTQITNRGNEIGLSAGFGIDYRLTKRLSMFASVSHKLFSMNSIHQTVVKFPGTSTSSDFLQGDLIQPHSVLHAKELMFRFGMRINFGK